MQPRQEFLTQSQRESLAKSILSIQNRLKKLPVQSHIILMELQAEDVHYLSEVDPDGKILMEKLFRLNEDALYKQFHQIGDSLVELIGDNMDSFEREHSLMSLKDEISNQVNRACSSDNFQLRLQENWRVAGSTLWDTMHDQLIQIGMGIIGFMHYHFQMALSEVRREAEVNCCLQSFRQRFDGRHKLNKIYVLTQKLEQEMLQFKDESKIIDFDNKQDEWNEVMQKFQNIEKKDQNQVKIEQQKMEIEQISKNSAKRNTLGIVKGKLENTFKNVKALISKSSPYQQKSIDGIELEQNLQDYLENLTYFQLPQTTKEHIQVIVSLDLAQLEDCLHFQFNQRQMDIIKFAIRKPMEKWHTKQNSIGIQSQLYGQTIVALSNYSSQLNTAIKRLIPGQKKSQMGEYLLTGFLYRVLEKDYCPFAKRYLMKVLKIIENEIQRDNKTQLRGALRIFEVTTINPTKTATTLSKLKPSRSKEYQQSYQSKIYLENNHFEDDQQVAQEVKNTLIEIKNEHNFKEDIPDMSFLRLGLSPPSKTVTILISGFLSEDSAKDLQWMGMIRALQNTQLYSLSWRSSTLKETGLYAGKLAADLILNPLSLGGGAGILMNALKIGIRVVDEYKNNPFATAHIRAQAVGTYLAQFICKTFPDRFVNLVGFSLGTEVVFHCLKRMTYLKTMGIINRIVMLGGAADRQQTKRLLQNAPNSLQFLNLWSGRDYSIRYIYRFCKLGSTALGSDNLCQINGHDIININCSKFVKSHMDFRCNLYGIGLITGIVHD